MMDSFFLVSVTLIVSSYFGMIKSFASLLSLASSLMFELIDENYCARKCTWLLRSINTVFGSILKSSHLLFSLELSDLSRDWTKRYLNSTYFCYFEFRLIILTFEDLKLCLKLAGAPFFSEVNWTSWLKLARSLFITTLLVISGFKWCTD